MGKAFRLRSGWDKGWGGAAFIGKWEKAGFHLTTPGPSFGGKRREMVCEAGKLEVR